MNLHGKTHSHSGHHRTLPGLKTPPPRLSRNRLTMPPPLLVKIPDVSCAPRTGVSAEPSATPYEQPVQAPPYYTPLVHRSGGAMARIGGYAP